MIKLLASMVVLLIGIVIYLYNSYASIKKNIQKLEQEHLKCRKDLRLVGAGTIGVGQRINRLEEHMHRISSRQDVAELKQGTVSSYSHAAKIVEIGGDVKDIVEGCGLTRAEAELVAMLHKKPKVG